MSRKVLFIIDNFYPHRTAGSVRVLSFYKKLSNIKGIIATVVGGSSISNPKANQRYFLVNRPSENNPLQFLWFLLKFMWLSTIQILKNDIVIISVPKYEILLLAVIAYTLQKKVIIDLRDSPLFLDYKAYLKKFLPSSLATIIGNLVHHIIFFILKISAKASDYILVANKGISADLKLILSKKDCTKIEILENGVNEFFLNEDPVKERVRKRLTLGYIGNFSEKDIFDPIIEAFNQSLEFNLVLIGLGRNVKKVVCQLESKAKNNRVEYIGEVDHSSIPKTIKNKIDLGFIFRTNSAKASVPVSIIEFSSLGVPVVVNDVGRMSEFVSENGGFVISKKSDFVKLIKKLTKINKRPCLKGEQVNAIRLKFSRIKAAEKLERLILSI